MKLTDIKRKVIRHYQNSKGWRTKRKILIIESDDWGSIRMPSREVYEKFLAMGFPVDKLSYLKYDALESNTDMEMLFNILESFKDKNGNHPVITANTIMTNPDFEKIRASEFQEYHYELFTRTLERYPEHDHVFNYYLAGIKNKIFYPQLHGMEHLNINRWMKALQANNKKVMIAFDHEFYDIGVKHTIITEDSFVDALTPETQVEINEHNQRLKKAASIFESLFGYNSKSFIAPCYIWRNEHENGLKQIGIKNIQSGTFQLIPKIGMVSNFNKRIHFTGERNKLGQSYTVRNCAFEPSSNQQINTVDSCLKQINNAYRNNKPAIISSHRLNFIGFIDKNNRDNNLMKFDQLLERILDQWPDVEFFTSEDLIQLMNE